MRRFFLLSSLLGLWVLNLQAQEEIVWIKEYEKGMALAAATGKPAMIDFYTTW